MSQAGAAPPKQEEKSLSVQESLSEISDSDVAKFPALFGVRTIIKTDPEEARSQLIEARLSSYFISKLSFLISGCRISLFIENVEKQGNVQLQPELIKYY